MISLHYNIGNVALGNRAQLKCNVNQIQHRLHRSGGQIIKKSGEIYYDSEISERNLNSEEEDLNMVT